MKQLRWFLKLTFILVFVACLTYGVQILIFKNPPDTAFYFFQDLAFLPIEVLLVTLLLNHLMKRREKNNLLEKMNMVIGIFFSEMGTQVLHHLYSMDLSNQKEVGSLYKKIAGFAVKRKELKQLIDRLPFKMKMDMPLIKDLKILLLEKRSCLTRILENPNLLEHESFTDLLWAISHLTEELKIQRDIREMNENDLDHLEQDIIRAYSRILFEWMIYLYHLKEDYPYVFSLYQRNDPLA